MVKKIEYTRPFLYPYQKAIIDSKARFTFCAAATKVGKTASHIVWAFEQSLILKEGQSGWWVAPTFLQAKIAYDRMKIQISDRNIYTSNDTNLVIKLITGGQIHFKTAEKPDNLYGDDVYFFVFDEFTRAREEAWFAMRSTITATGGKGKFIGNVKGKKNWGYQLCMKAKNGQDKEYEFFKIDCYDAANAGMITKDGRPFIEEIRSAQKDLPENVFRELYLAEPSEDGSNPFGIQFIRKCVYPISNTTPVCFGVDLAKKHDFTVITGLDVHGNICYFDRFQLDWKQTIERIIALPPGNLNIDSTGVGDPIAESVEKHRNVRFFNFTGKSKQQIMEGLALAIQRRGVTVLEGVMQDELENFEFQYTRSGVKYSAPDGAHDDCVCSLALANDILPDSQQTGRYSVI